MSTGLRLFCPADRSDWSVALITEREVELCKSVASRLGIAININKEHGKLYLGRSPGYVPPAPAIPGKLPQVYWDAPYYRQWDSEVEVNGENQGRRMCNASTHAMMLEYYLPGTLTKTPRQPDDLFLRRVFAQYNGTGDTTDTTAQVKALASYGLLVSFSTKATWEQLLERLKDGPCGAGLLHHGPSNRPTGGGHWMLVVGWDPDSQEVVCHDPNGRMDIINGGYSDYQSGPAVRYQRTHWVRRWAVEGGGSGYMTWRSK